MFYLLKTLNGDFKIVEKVEASPHIKGKVQQYFNRVVEDDKKAAEAEEWSLIVKSGFYWCQTEKKEFELRRYYKMTGYLGSYLAFEVLDRILIVEDEV